MASGCGKSTGTTTKTLSYYMASPTGIEPYTLEEPNGAGIAMNLFDSLTFYDTDSKSLKPLCAESWSPNATADEWTFHIKRGQKFHDGTDVTARSFVLAWNRLCSPSTTDTPSAVSYHLAPVQGYDEVQSGNAESLSGLSTPDDYTLVVKLSKPFAEFDYVCSAPVTSPMPASCKDDYASFARSPVGNGPFKMKGSWADGQYVEMEKFADYAGQKDKPKIDVAHVSIYKDTETAYKEFEAGSLDVSGVPPARYKDAVDVYGKADYKAEPGSQTLMGTMMYTNFYFFNLKDPVIAKPEVRKALSMAINRQAICDSIYGGYAKVATDIIPESIEGYQENLWSDVTTYDPEKAAALLDAAGYPLGSDGKRGLAIDWMTESTNTKVEFEAVQADWAALGLDVNMSTIEFAAQLTRFDAFNYQVGNYGWYADYPIADNFLYPLLYSSSGDNKAGYSNAEFDSCIDRSRSETDHAKSIDYLQQADRVAAQDCALLVMFYKPIGKVAAKTVSDLMVSPQNMPLLWQASIGS